MPLLPTVCLRATPRKPRTPPHLVHTDTDTTTVVTSISSIIITRPTTVLHARKSRRLWTLTRPHWQRARARRVRGHVDRPGLNHMHSAQCRRVPTSLAVLAHPSPTRHRPARVARWSTSSPPRPTVHPRSRTPHENVIRVWEAMLVHSMDDMEAMHLTVQRGVWHLVVRVLMDRQGAG